MDFLWPGCAAVALERAVKVFPAVSRFQPHAVPHLVRGSAVARPWLWGSVTREGGPDPLPRVAQHSFDLLELGFGGLSPKVGIKVHLPIRGDVSRPLPQ